MSGPTVNERARKTAGRTESPRVRLAVRFLKRWFWMLAMIVAGLASTPEPARAWGQYGHLAVCDLAYRNFTPATRDAIVSLLRSRSGGILVKGRGKLPDRRYTSFNLGCLEEDARPRRHPDDHFINVTREVQTIDGPTCPGNGDCILSGITRDLDILKDASKSDEERVFALMALGHWIGDIHQPLHVSFADDLGGNGVLATVERRCGSSTYRVKNLHGVWDNCLLEAGPFERVRKRADFKKSWGKNTITYRVVDTLQANTSLSDERAMVGGEPWRWAAESYEITLEPDTLYCTQRDGACRYSQTVDTLKRRAPKRTQPVSQAYLAQFAPVAEQRVKLAGFRLAHLINGALDPSYSGPVQNSTQAP